MFSFVDLRLLLLLAATALLTHGQEEGQEEDSKSQTLGSPGLLGVAPCAGSWESTASTETRDAPETRGWKGDDEGASSAPWERRARTLGGGMEVNAPRSRKGGWSATWLAQDGVLSAHGAVPLGKRGSEREVGESTSKMGWGRRAGNLEPKM